MKERLIAIEHAIMVAFQMRR